MTEDEAKTKWCPFARVLVQSPDINGTGNRLRSSDDLVIDNPKEARCIGSACMAWRWLPRLLEVDPKEGYCGLAGEPE